MNVLCAICQDLLVPSSDIFTTPCGHVFHFPCLNQWLEKSKSCPQCRAKVLREKVTRIFFNFTTTEDIKEDSVTLQQKVDSLSFQVKLKETEYKNCLNESASIKKQFSGLREEFKKVESELHSKKAVIRAMKDEVGYFQNKFKNYEKLQDEKKKLESQITQYEGIKSLLRSSEEYVERMVKGTTDVYTLSTYVSIMKRELNECLLKRKQLRETVRRLQQELQNLKVEKTTSANNHLKQIEELQEGLAVLRNKNDVLRKEIADLKSQDESDDTSNEESESERSVSTAPSRKRRIDFDESEMTPQKRKKVLEQLISTTSEKNDDSDIVFDSPVPVKKPKENEENSPYLKTKSKSVLRPTGKSVRGNEFSLKLVASPSKKSGSKFMNSQNQDESIVFDGFGGHSKPENFPLPKISSLFALKRAVVGNTTKSKKIKLDLLNKKPMDDFVINLT